MRDGPAEFWERLLVTGLDDEALDGGFADPVLVADADGVDAPVDLAEQRRRRRPSRWVAAAAGVAAAFVIGAVVFVPQERSVTPPVAAFTQAHNVRSSLQDDAVSSLVPLAVQGGFRR
jgi:hypothetical protein